MGKRSVAHLIKLSKHQEMKDSGRVLMPIQRKTRNTVIVNMALSNFYNKLKSK